MPEENNRILDGILMHVEQEVIYRINNPVGSVRDGQSFALQQQYYESLVRHFKNKLSPEEKATRAYLKNEIRKFKVKRNPGLLSILINGRPGRWLRSLLTGNLKNISRHKEIVEQHQNRTGIEQNVENLSQSLIKTGFTNNMESALKKMVNQGLPEFHLRYSDVRHPNTDFILHFNHIPGTGAYELLSFDVATRPSRFNSQFQEKQMWYKFKSGFETSLSASLAANLVGGRAVCRDDSNNWLVLDKTTATLQQVSFDVHTALSKIPLEKIDRATYKNIIKTLKAGASKEITLSIDGELQKYRLIAVPQQNTIHVLDNLNRPIDLNIVTTEAKRQAEKMNNVINFNIENNQQRAQYQFHAKR